MAPDLVVADHKSLGFGTLHGRAAYIAWVRAMVDLAPDAHLRVQHLRSCERARLVVTNFQGTYEGGAFERPRTAVAELDRSGCVSRFDFYDDDQIDLALARFEELRPARA